MSRAYCCTWSKPSVRPDNNGTYHWGMSSLVPTARRTLAPATRRREAAALAALAPNSRRGQRRSHAGSHHSLTTTVMRLAPVAVTLRRTCPLLCPSVAITFECGGWERSLKLSSECR